MTLLNEADKIYIGGVAADRVYAGVNKVWPKALRPWTPIDLGVNLLAWYDAADAASVIVTGSGVSQLTDKSANARNAVQSNDTFRPPYAANKISFGSGTQRHLVLSGFPDIYDFVIAMRPSAPDYRVVLYASGGGGMPLMLDPSDYFGSWTYSGFTWSGLLWPSGVDGIGYGSISNTVNATLSRNGGPLNSIGSPVQISAPVAISRSDYIQSFGDLYELVFVPYGAPLDTKQKLEGYIAHKWGMAGLLPPDHPYKNSAPEV